MKPNSKQKKYFGLTTSALLHTPGLHFWALFYILFSSHLVIKGFVVIVMLNYPNLEGTSYCFLNFLMYYFTEFFFFFLYFSGMGPMPWTVNSEIYPLWARSTGNACSSGINWIFNVLVSLTFLHTAEYLTYYGKRIFFSAIVSFVFSYTIFR